MQMVLAWMSARGPPKAASPTGVLCPGFGITHSKHISLPSGTNSTTSKGTGSDQTEGEAQQRFPLLGFNCPPWEVLHHWAVLTWWRLC